MPEMQEKKIITDLNINAKEGSFSLVKPISFDTCRERFARVFVESTDAFYLAVPPKGSVNVAKFMWKFEEVLNLKDYTEFAETTYPTILWIRPTNWWKSCIMRRSLLTALVRAGMFYDSEKNNFEHALFTAKHLCSTKRALMRFLFGFTQYKGPKLDTQPGSTMIVKGWHSVFNTASEIQVMEYLSWPENNPIKLSVESALWL